MTLKRFNRSIRCRFLLRFHGSWKNHCSFQKAGETQAYKWESTADGSYTIEECTKDSRGTNITITLLPEFYGDKAEENFTDTYKLQSLVKKYSDYVRYPIKMNFVVEEQPKDADGKPIEGAGTIKKNEIRILNSMQPLWAKNKSEIKEEEYTEFYQNLFHDWEKPMEVMHNKIEGNIEYTSLLFFPAHAPYNLYHSDYEPGLQLYSRHVFIMDKCKDLLPEYLRFVKGLVDSPDFSLNISRELLQQSRELKLIGKNLEKTILKQLANTLKKDRSKYEQFWKEYGKSLKIGIYGSVYNGGSDVVNKLKDLLLFTTSKEDKLITLKEYVENMPESQKKSTMLQVKTVQASIAYHRWKFYAIKVLMYYTSLITLTNSLLKLCVNMKVNHSTPSAVAI